MGFLDDARDAITQGIDAVDKKGYEIGAQSRIHDQEVKRAGVYAKLGERLYTAAQTTDEYKEFAPDLFAQIVEIDAQIKSLEDDLAKYKEQKSEAAQARAASKGMRDEPSSAEASEAPVVKFCPQCGAAFTGDEKFCAQCGAERK
jgi:hypothetical protein